MTIGIAIICDTGRSVVVAADRMTDISAGASNIKVQVDTDSAKLRVLNSTAANIFSGVTPDRDSILAKAGDMAGVPVEDVANRLKRAFLEFHQQSLDEMLRKTGLKLEDLKEPLPNNTVASAVLKAVCDYSVQGSFLLAGVDDRGARIFNVDASFGTSYDHVGFYAVGSGSLYALPFLSSRHASQGLTLEEGINVAYEAKRLAEEAYGVGEKTDIAVLSVGAEPSFLSAEALDLLKRIYLRRLQLDDSDMAMISRAVRGVTGHSALAVISAASKTATKSKQSARRKRPG
jgi:Proteasome subunit